MPIDYKKDGWINILFTNTLLLDTVCWKCFSWMDKEIDRHSARKFPPYTKGNPNIIYYEDRSLYELQSGKDWQQPVCYPVYLP